jgi:hypothetical protein
MSRSNGTWISEWNPEDETFWNLKGRAVALRNLIWSIIAEHLGFSIWLIWSVVATKLPQGDRNNPAGCMGVQSALVCGDDSAAIRRELASRRRSGEAAIRRRLQRAKAEGDLPPKSDPADLARFLSVLIYGMAVQSAGGASRKELLKVAEIVLKQWPER